MKSYRRHIVQKKKSAPFYWLRSKLVNLMLCFYLMVLLNTSFFI